MKKIILLSSIMMCSLTTFAQHEVGTFTIQPKVGLNIANITDADDNDPRIGLAAGAEFEYQITQLFSMSLGAIYSMQGIKATSMESGIKVHSTMKMDYINFPILANIYIAKGLAIKFGVQPGFNVLSKIKSSAQGYDVSVSLSELGIDTNSFDFSVPVGLSYEYKNFVLDGRYNIGVTKIVDGDDSKNRVFQITLGYKFKL